MISEIFQQLDDDVQTRLMIGFENDFAQHVELSEGMFLGVHIPDDPKFNVLEQSGVWTYGELKDE